MATIQEVMTRELVTTSPAVSVGEAAASMGVNRIGSLVVMDGERFAGIFTERDVVRALSQDPGAAEQPLRQWMTSQPITAAPDTPVNDALRTMIERHFRHLPVVDAEGGLQGIVSIRDLARAALGPPSG